MRDWLVEHKLSVEHADLNRWVVLADSHFEMVRDIVCRRVQLALAGKLVHRSKVVLIDIPHKVTICPNKIFRLGPSARSSTGTRVQKFWNVSELAPQSP